MSISPSHTGTFGAALLHDPLPIGGVAVALMLGTSALLNVPVDLPLLVAGFCGVSLTYVMDRVWAYAPEDQVNHPARIAWLRAHTEWLVLETAVLFATAGAMVFSLRGTTLVGAGVLGGVVGLHLLSPERGSLRTGGVGKPLTIAGAWAVGATLLPLLEAGKAIGLGGGLFCLYRLLFILPNLMMADWGDRAGDAAAGLAPWAARWTGPQVRWVATASLLGAIGGAVGWAILGEAPLLIGVDAVGPGLMLGVVWGLDCSRPDHALIADLVVGWPLFPALLDWMIV